MFLFAYNDYIASIPPVTCLCTHMSAIVVVFGYCLYQLYMVLKATNLDAHVVWMYHGFVAIFTTLMIHFYLPLFPTFDWDGVNFKQSGILSCPSWCLPLSHAGHSLGLSSTKCKPNFGTFPCHDCDHSTYCSFAESLCISAVIGNMG